MPHLKKLSLLPLLVCVALPLFAAEDSGLEEHIPEGVRPDPAQREVVRALAAMAIRCSVRYDEDGDVAGIYLSNHGKDTPREVDDKKAYRASKPGVDDATFARLSELPDVRRLQMLQQPVSDAGFAVLDQWPNLEVFTIEGHKGDQTADFMLFIDDHPELKWLELKHLFGLDASRVDEIGELPSLERLELDNRSATAQALPFLERNPTIRDFELHRSSMTNDEIGRLVDALPNLERLALKPGGGKDRFDHRCLAHIPRLQKLQVLGFHHWKDDMYVWEDGFEHVVDMETLTHLEIPDKQWDLPAVQRLREARPDLERAGKHIIVDM